MLKMLLRALVTGTLALSSSAVLAGESFVVCVGEIKCPENAKRVRCGTPVEAILKRLCKTTENQPKQEGAVASKPAKKAEPMDCTPEVVTITCPTR
jgi:hypothetical protein